MSSHSISSHHDYKFPLTDCGLSSYVAVEPKFRTVILYTIYVLTAFLIACQAVVFFQCKPLEKAWLPHKYPNSGTCTSITTFFYSTSVFNIVSDVWILILPVKLVWSVQRHITQKIALFGVFLMGIFACIASCVRLYVSAAPGRLKRRNKEGQRLTGFWYF